MGSHQLTDPEDIAASTFGTSFRGYDPAEVRSYLAAVAKRLSSALERVDVLEQETRDLQVKAGASTESAPDPTDLTRWLGAETAKVLDAANAAAESQRARAVDEADELVTEARARAESIVEDAERNRSDVLDAATVEADSILSEAEAVRTSVQEHYDTELERARDEAERLIAEATAVRETMLVELADQRHEVRGQIEQLKAGRDALMGALSNASTVVGGVFDDLEDAMPSARRVAEVAAHKVSRSPITVAEYDRYVVEVDLDESPTDS
ncbi:MAG: DivIVA domain-containing protein, partial [Acidobacteria bacterium]|nr:DivIVA domain-containing protein [Acidobacteriota bacterium]